MNLSSSSLVLFLASTVAAHSAQDIIASPRIAKLLTHQDDGDYACTEELYELVDCVGGWEGECVTCIGNVFADLTDHTCDYLEGTSICADLGMCTEGSCAIEHCIAPAVALELCEDENEVEDECPGLCPDLGWATDKCSARVCPDGVSPGQEDTPIPGADGLSCADGYVYAMTVEAGSEECDRLMEDKATCCPDAMNASFWKDLVSLSLFRLKVGAEKPVFVEVSKDKKYDGWTKTEIKDACDNPKNCNACKRDCPSKYKKGCKEYKGCVDEEASAMA